MNLDVRSAVADFLKDTNWARSRSERCSSTDPGTSLMNGFKATREYGAGAIIYTEGEECHGIYCIESGLVGQRKFDGDGNSVLIRLCAAGEAIGYRALLDLTQAEERFLQSATCPYQNQTRT